MTRDKAFYKTFFSLYWPLVLHQIITLSVNLLDNVMIGAYSEDALSGVATINQIQFLFGCLVSGAGDALVALCSQFWGQKDKVAIKKVSSAALLFGACLGGLLFVLASLFPREIVDIFTNDPQVIIFGAEYLSTIRFTYIIFALTNLLLAMLRSVETVKLGLYVSLSSLVINGVLNYLLIYGNCGFPRLGVTGAAVATLVARVVELLVVCYFVFVRDKKLRYQWRDLFSFDGKIFGAYMKTGWRFWLVSGMFGLSTALQTVILGNMTKAAIAANSVASTLYQMLKVMAVGAASASAVIIGKTLGEAKSEAECLPTVKSYAKTLQVIYLIIGAVISTSLFVLKNPVLSLYTELSDEAFRLAKAFILVLCVTGFGTAYQMPVLTGIVRGGGDSKFILYNDLISIWGIVLPLSYLAAFVWHLPPTAVVFLLNSDQIFKCGAAAIKVNRFRWMKKIGKMG